MGSTSLMALRAVVHHLAASATADALHVADVPDEAAGAVRMHHPRLSPEQV